MPTAHCIGEKAYRGVPGQAYRLGCVKPPPFSLPRDDLRPDTKPLPA